jgi:hypothetical protein
MGRTGKNLHSQLEPPTQNKKGREIAPFLLPGKMVIYPGSDNQARHLQYSFHLMNLVYEDIGLNWG